MSRKAHAKPDQSVFGRVLSQMLDETGFFTRAEWADVLNVSASAVSQWVNDKTVPRPDLLRIVLDILRSRGGAKGQDAVLALEAILDRSSEEISPIGSRFSPNLRSYLRVRSFAEEGRTLRDEIRQEREELQARGASSGPNAAVLVDGQHRLTSIAGSFPVRAWRLPTLVRESGQHGREQYVPLDRFAACDRVILSGTAGSGKSWLLSRLLEQDSRWQNADRLAVRKFSGESWEQDVHAWIVNKSNSPLVVDGFDEVPAENRRRIAIAINEWSVRWSAPIIVASRPVEELDLLHRFDRFAIAPMSDAEVVAEITSSPMAVQRPREVERFLCHMVERKNLHSSFRHPFFLDLAMSAFESEDLTAFSDGKLVENYVRNLFNRDRARNFHDPEEWAAPDVLLRILGEVATQLLTKQQRSFEEIEVSRWARNIYSGVDTGKLLDLLVSLGLLVKQDRKFQFLHRMFQDYFAASQIIGRFPTNGSHWRIVEEQFAFGEAFRLACSLSDDATPLLQAALSNGENEDANMRLLARTIAQPLSAEPKVLQQGCKRLVSWLDRKTADWTVVAALDDLDQDISRWAICAKFTPQHGLDGVSDALRSLHQARSGPACDPLRVYLRDAGSRFLPIFAEALEVEGKLSVMPNSSDISMAGARVAVDGLVLT